VKKALLLLMSLTLFLFANGLKTVHSYQNALHKAAREHKLVMVMMSYSGCPLCDYMKDIVLERPKVQEYLNEHFYVVIKDLQKDRYPQRFSVIDTPTFFFIDPRTRKDIIRKKSGGFRPDDFLALLHKATGEPMPQKRAETNTTDANNTVTASASVTHSDTDTNTSLAPCHKNTPCKESRKIKIN
jgi:thioredoxin-related protein